MTLLARLVALERGREPHGGLPFLCWRVTDAQLEQVATEWNVTVERLTRRLTAIHQASEDARRFFRVPAGKWRAQPLRTALAAYLMADEEGAFGFQQTEDMLRAVADAVGPSRFVWDTAMG